MGRRIRRRLGLPVLSRRTWLLTILGLLLLVYVAVAVVPDFVMKASQYAPGYYEPKDFSREPAEREPERKQ